MIISSAQYFKNLDGTENGGVTIVVDNETLHIPQDPDNRHYAEILKQVEEGTLTIKDAD